MFVFACIITRPCICVVSLRIAVDKKQCRHFRSIAPNLESLAVAFRLDYFKRDLRYHHYNKPVLQI